MMATQQKAQQKPTNPHGAFSGASNVGQFRTHARCMIPIEDYAWVADRGGYISIRSARSGDEIKRLELSNPYFVNVMVEVENDVWCGCSDGYIRVFPVKEPSVTAMVQIPTPELEHNAEITDMLTKNRMVFSGTAACRIFCFNVEGRKYLRSFEQPGPINCMSCVGNVLYAGDTTGLVAGWNIESGERICSNEAEDSFKDKQAVTSMMLEGTNRLLWVGRNDGLVFLYQTHPTLKVVDMITAHANSKVMAMGQVGGKVWTGGSDKQLHVWHAQTLQPLGKIKDAGGFINEISKVYTMETARFWVLSNDRAVRMYDAEGFFSSVRNNSSEQAEIARLQALFYETNIEKGLVQKRLSNTMDKLSMRDAEIEHLRSDVKEYQMKVHALEHVVDTKEQAISGGTNDKQKVMEQMTDLNQKLGVVTVKLNATEQESIRMRGEVAKTNEESTRVKAEAKEKSNLLELTTNERNMLLADKHKLTEQLLDKEKGIAVRDGEIKLLRDKIICKDLELKRKTAELENVNASYAVMEKSRVEWLEQRKQMEEMKRRLEDAVIVKDNEFRELQQQLNRIHGDSQRGQNELAEMCRIRNSEVGEARKLQDSYVLRSHEFEILRKERDQLLQQLQVERNSVYDTRSTEGKLRAQNDELKRQLEVEKNTVRMLEDQYTIFQFVINSRGELVSSIWKLHEKLAQAAKSLKSVDANIKHIDPSKDRMALQKDWKDQVAGKVGAAIEALADVTRHNDYIVANYFSEFEKLHLGISSYKFQPDETRPQVLGDELLTKLREVTPMKQFSASAASGGGVAKPSGTPGGAAAATGFNSTALPLPSVLRSQSQTYQPSGMASNSMTTLSGAVPPAPYTTSVGPELLQQHQAATQRYNLRQSRGGPDIASGPLNLGSTVTVSTSGSSATQLPPKPPGRDANSFAINTSQTSMTFLPRQ